MLARLRAAWRGLRGQALLDVEHWHPLGGAGNPLAGPGRRSDAGPVVSPESVLALSAAWACTAATAQIVASLPCHLFERQRNGQLVRLEAPELEQVVFAHPNQVQTGVEFWEGATAQQLIQGNAYARKLMLRGRLVGLEPLLGVVPKRRGAGFEYRVPREEGGVEVLQASEVLHLRGFGVGGGLGLSAVRHGAQSFGAALAADRSAARVFAQGLQPSGVLEADQVLQPDQRAQLQTLLEAYSGSDKAGKAMVLEGGLKWRALQWNPEDVQLLQTRAFQVEDICRWFGCPPVVIGHQSQGQTMWGTGVEAILLGWLRTGINPILVRNEARLNLDAVPVARRGRWVWQYDREAMLQMDSRAKGLFLSAMATSGTMTANERRARLGLAPHGDPQADDLLAQTALAPLRDLVREGSENGGAT
jgi:HK97 family phage portal protein